MPVAMQIAATQIVRQQENDVGWLILCGTCNASPANQNCGGKSRNRKCKEPLSIHQSVFRGRFTEAVAVVFQWKVGDWIAVVFCFLCLLTELPSSNG